MQDVAAIAARRQIDDNTADDRDHHDIADARHLLPSNIRIPFPDADVVATPRTSRVLQLASGIGVPIPRPCWSNRRMRSRKCCSGSSIRPCSSRRARVPGTGERWISGGTNCSKQPMTSGAGTTLLHQRSSQCPEIQERIQGPGAGVFVMCCGPGLAGARLSRTGACGKPPSGGVSVFLQRPGGSGREGTCDPSAPEHWLARCRHGGVHGTRAMAT